MIGIIYFEVLSIVITSIWYGVGFGRVSKYTDPFIFVGSVVTSRESASAWIFSALIIPWSSKCSNFLTSVLTLDAYSAIRSSLTSYSPKNCRTTSCKSVQAQSLFTSKLFFKWILTNKALYSTLLLVALNSNLRAYWIRKPLGLVKIKPALLFSFVDGSSTYKVQLRVLIPNSYCSMYFLLPLDSHLRNKIMLQNYARAWPLIVVLGFYLMLNPPSLIVQVTSLPKSLSLCKIFLSNLSVNIVIVLPWKYRRSLHATITKAYANFSMSG